MIKIINQETIKRAIKKIKEKLEENKDYLNELDSDIGDSDHGRSIVNAFKEAYSTVDGSEYDGIGDLMNDAASSIISASGGASGVLYGSAFMAAAREVQDKNEIGHEDLGNMLQAMNDKIMDRGGAEPGDKTMVDTLHPAVQAYKESGGIEQGLDAALEAAAEGRDSTEEMIASKGRSSRLGDRSKGHIDPGAESMYLILETLFETIKEDL